MRHDPIRSTHRVGFHPDWCGCPACDPPAPSRRRHREPDAAILAGTALGAVLICLLHAAGADRALTVLLFTAGS